MNTKPYETLCPLMNKCKYKPLVGINIPEGDTYSLSTYVNLWSSTIIYKCLTYGKVNPWTYMWTYNKKWIECLNSTELTIKLLADKIMRQELTIIHSVRIEGNLLSFALDLWLEGTIQITGIGIPWPLVMYRSFVLIPTGIIEWRPT